MLLSLTTVNKNWNVVGYKARNGWSTERSFQTSLGPNFGKLWIVQLFTYGPRTLLESAVGHWASPQGRHRDKEINLCDRWRTRWPLVHVSSRPVFNKHDSPIAFGSVLQSNINLHSLKLDCFDWIKLVSSFEPYGDLKVQTYHSY